MNHTPKQDGRMIWLDQIRRPIWLHCRSHFSVPTFGKHLLTLSCHFPFWQMSHTRRAGHPSERWGTGLQLHQGCYRQWSRGRFFHFFYCSGISAGWKTSHAVISAPFMAVFVRTIWSLVIPRYEVLTSSWEGGVEPITMLETRSHPPEMKSCFLNKEKQPFKGGRCSLGKNWPSSKQFVLSTMPRQICIILFSI